MKTRNKVLATVIAGLVSASAFGATADGSMGSTSTGNVDINLQVLDSVEISALNTIDFGTYGGTDTGNVNDGDDFCVYRNGGDGYTITVSSSNGKFSLVGGLGDEIDYTVKLAGTAGGAAAAAAVAYNSTTATFTGSSARDCGSSDNASVDVSITEADIRTASTDTYADTLILLVNPI